MMLSFHEVYHTINHHGKINSTNYQNDQSKRQGPVLCCHTIGQNDLCLMRQLKYNLFHVTLFKWIDSWITQFPHQEKGQNKNG